jgi:hypothetical protein
MLDLNTPSGRRLPQPRFRSSSTQKPSHRRPPPRGLAKEAWLRLPTHRLRSHQASKATRNHNNQKRKFHSAALNFHSTALQRDICSQSIRILHSSEPPPLPDPPLSHATTLTSRHPTLNPDSETPHSTTQDLQAHAPCNYSSKNGTPTPHPPRLSPSPSSSIISSPACQRP